MRRTSSTTTYKATQTVLHQLYEMNPPSYTWLYKWANNHPLQSEFLPAFEYLFDCLLELTLLLLSATFSLGWTIRWRLFPSPARNGIIHLLRFCLFWQNWQKNMSISALCYGSFLWLGSYLTGEAGPGLVSDDHTPSPIRQMDQGSNSDISSSAKSERNTNLGHKLNLPLCFVPGWTDQFIGK